MHLGGGLGVLAVSILVAGCATPIESKAPPREWTFYVFNVALDFNETALGISHDAFSPSQLVVNQGENVTIHFYNTEESENHTFTMDAPYATNTDVAPGGEANVTFVANTAGIFAYRCMLHQPTMTGYLVVLGK